MAAPPMEMQIWKGEKVKMMVDVMEEIAEIMEDILEEITYKMMIEIMNEIMDGRNISTTNDADEQKYCC